MLSVWSPRMLQRPHQPCCHHLLLWHMLSAWSPPAQHLPPRDQPPSTHLLWHLPRALLGAWLLRAIMLAAQQLPPYPQTWAGFLSQPASSPMSVKHHLLAKDDDSACLHCPKALQLPLSAAQQMACNEKLCKKMFWPWAFSFPDLFFPCFEKYFNWEVGKMLSWASLL